MTTRLDTIRTELENELEIAEAEAGRLKTELAAADKDVKAIKDALTALGRRPRQAAKKPALKKADVIKALAAILAKAGKPVPREQIEGHLRELAEANGKSATGLGLRIKEALATDQFEQSEQGISLSADEMRQAEKSAV